MSPGLFVRTARVQAQASEGFRHSGVEPRVVGEARARIPRGRGGALSTGDFAPGPTTLRATSLRAPLPMNERTTSRGRAARREPLASVAFTRGGEIAHESTSVPSRSKTTRGERPRHAGRTRRRGRRVGVVLLLARPHVADLAHQPLQVLGGGRRCSARGSGARIPPAAERVGQHPLRVGEVAVGELEQRLREGSSAPCRTGAPRPRAWPRSCRRARPGTPRSARC